MNTIIEQKETVLTNPLSPFQQKIQKAILNGFEMCSFEDICSKMGFTVTLFGFSPYMLEKGSARIGLVKMMEQMNFGDYAFVTEHHDPQNAGLITCDWLAVYLGKVSEYAIPLKKSISDSINQTKDNFDEIRILAPFSHFSQYKCEAKDPYTVGVIYNDEKTNRVLFPILRWI